MFPTFNVIHFTVRQYIEGMMGTDTELLLDLLSSASSEDIEPTRKAGARGALYPEVGIRLTSQLHYLMHAQYLPAATLVAGVKSGQLHQGHFKANTYNYLEVCALHSPE